MKLRRALVTAAATAAIAPIALLSAPAAFADETPGTSTETTATTPAAESTESTPAEETPAGETPPTQTPGTETTTPAETTPTSPPATTTPSPTGSTSPSETAKPTDEPGDDECTDFEDSPGTLAELRGLPSKIVAGSGWHSFSYRVSNYTDTAFESVYAEMYAFSFAYDKDTTDTTRYLHVQWSDGSGWHDLDIDFATSEQPFAELGALAPGKHADVALRIKVDAKAPAGIGGSLAFATSVTADGVCGYSVPEDQEYSFEVLAAGTTPGKVPDATAKPKPSNTPAPQSSSTPVSGSLASTGSSSMLPTFGLVAGVAVVAGAGVVYSVRRRKAAGEA
ncbi:peptidase [Streptomyces sp. VRA16 Mangrove soil]|uniref:peptidase n=1 Tax=Streptomyces sp. VRA16 Mangrove soil TaxID=2817434 RepID=UPI001A9D50F6|nr:peptidase [Streptomyces sp. VRA16 Mangrove soil]MBO1335108.1 peptidase [Streptomyces sp. VRA16 Mangrove soil]